MNSAPSIKLREQITDLPIGSLKPAARNPRTHSRKQLGMKSVPVLSLADFSADERKAYALADKKIALNPGWDGVCLCQR